MSFIRGVENAFLGRLREYVEPLEFIPDYGGGPEPKGDYGVFGITLLNKINENHNHYLKTDDGYKESILQDFEILSTITFYGDSCYENALETQAYLQMRDTQEDFYYNDGLSVIGTTSVSRSPELRETGYINKASYTLNMLTRYKLERDIDWFDTIEHTANYKDISGDPKVVYTDTIKVSK